MANLTEPNIASLPVIESTIELGIAEESVNAAGLNGAASGVDRGRHDALRAEVHRIKAERGCSMQQLSKEIGIVYGTFSQWQAGTYGGNFGKYDDLVQRWLDTRSSATRARSVLPDAPGFLMTAAASQFFAVFEHAQHAPDMVLVSGGAGVGKSIAIEAYRATAPNVWLISGEPCMSTPRMMLDELSETLGVTESRSTHRISRAIVARMKGSKGLLIVDEAQQLGTTTLDQLRTLHDQAEIGLALVGNEKVVSRIEGGVRNPDFAQLYSRVGQRVSRARPTRADIEMLLDAWMLTGAAERKLMSAIARKPGALRSMTKVLRMATMNARAAGETVVSVRFIEMAYQSLSAQPRDAGS